MVVNGLDVKVGGGFLSIGVGTTSLNVSGGGTFEWGSSCCCCSCCMVWL